MAIIYKTSLNERKAVAEMDCARLGQCMAHYRNSRNYTQADVAMYIGVESSCISSWETGRTSPRMPHFFMWCDAVNVTPEDVMTATYGDE